MMFFNGPTHSQNVYTWSLQLEVHFTHGHQGLNFRFTVWSLMRSDGEKHRQSLFIEAAFSSLSQLSWEGLLQSWARVPSKRLKLVNLLCRAHTPLVVLFIPVFEILTLEYWVNPEDS